MSILHPVSTLAEQAARVNLSRNRAALARTQPDLLDRIPSPSGQLEWVFGRDGCLTARESARRWLGGCSVPLRAAEEMLQKLLVKGTIACFLAPTHSAQVRVALDRMKPQQALVALLPDMNDLAATLHCHDFSQDIESHRLWLVGGDDWETRLRQLFVDHPGLATPAQFIRVSATDAELLEQLITAAQRVIGEIVRQRAEAIEKSRQLPWRRPATMRLMVAASRRFRLWNDCGDVLVSAAREACGLADHFGWALFDADDPASSSPLALASVARQCSAILTANTARGDLPDLLPRDLPWITWITGQRIPDFAQAAAQDQLILCDPASRELARRAGWPAEQLTVATWPTLVRHPLEQSASAAIAIVADTQPLHVPEELNEYSSHALLWEAIARELLAAPFSLSRDPGEFLESRLRQLDIPPEQFPRAAFLNDLIVPAFQQGIARLLIEARVPMRLFGAGWSDLPQFASHAGGPVESRRQLVEILRGSKALVHVWPDRRAHPIDTCGVPVLRPLSSGRARFLELACACPTAPRGIAPAAVQPLNGQLLHNLLRPAGKDTPVPNAISSTHESAP